jgi:uncharacterized membrane protein YhdT
MTARRLTFATVAGLYSIAEVVKAAAGLTNRPTAWQMACLVTIALLTAGLAWRAARNEPVAAIDHVAGDTIALQKNL